MIVSPMEAGSSATPRRSNSRFPVEGIWSPLYSAEAGVRAGAGAVFLAAAFVIQSSENIRNGMCFICSPGEFIMQKESRLLTTQKNELVPIAQSVGFGMADFKWEHDDSFQEQRARGYQMGQFTTVTDTLLVSVLVHKRSGFYCKFGRHTMLISPGAVELIQRIYPTDRLVGFREWLTYLKREVDSPDLWDTLRNGAIDRLNQADLADAALQQADSRTAARELREANVDLSRRPPDLTGAVQHSLAALECVARERCDDSSTFGKLLQRYSDLFPRPLDRGIEKIWGFASEMGRHLREGRTPSKDEAELLVGLATVCCTYLARKIKTDDD